MWRTTTQQPSAPPVQVRLSQDAKPPVEHRFTSAFRVGRDEACEVHVDSGLASRVHAEVTFEQGKWWVHDLDSTNGTYLNGKSIQRTCLTGQMYLQIGKGGPVIQFAVAPAALDDPARKGPAKEAECEIDEASPPGSSVTRYIQRYFKDDGRPIGKHTQMIRKAYARVQQHQRQQYALALGVVLVLCASVGAYAFVQHRQNRRLQHAATDLFYQIKQQDLQIARLRRYAEETGDDNLSLQLARLEEQRREQARQYEGYIRELGLRHSLSENQKLIHQTARIFNESELEIPAGFARSVEDMIENYWLTPAGRQRFKSNVQRAEESGYTAFIVHTMREYGLPPEFFYLALQESDLDTEAVGPNTRWGVAKGMWQFIPSTGRRYGLRIGPRAGERVVDLQDDRHDFEKSTRAAARYLLGIYSELTQASGLLVMASYNWGEHRVVSKLDRLYEGIPSTPEDRNYWQFLTEYKDRMPEQTKDYVLKVFAAAVLGQNPRHFGLDLDNPLQHYLEAPPLRRFTPEHAHRPCPLPSRPLPAVAHF